MATAQIAFLLDSMDVDGDFTNESIERFRLHAMISL
jgi:hypothetical protein